MTTYLKRQSQHAGDEGAGWKTSETLNISLGCVSSVQQQDQASGGRDEREGEERNIICCFSFCRMGKISVLIKLLCPFKRKVEDIFPVLHKLAHIDILYNTLNARCGRRVCAVQASLPA